MACMTIMCLVTVLLALAAAATASVAADRLTYRTGSEKVWHTVHAGAPNADGFASSPSCPRAPPKQPSKREITDMENVLKAGLKRQLPRVPAALLVDAHGNVLEPPKAAWVRSVTFEKNQETVRLSFFWDLLDERAVPLDVCDHPLASVSRMSMMPSTAVRPWINPHYANTFGVNMASSVTPSTVAWATKNAVQGNANWNAIYSPVWQNYQTGHNGNNWLVHVPLK